MWGDGGWNTTDISDGTRRSAKIALNMTPPKDPLELTYRVLYALSLFVLTYAVHVLNELHLTMLYVYKVYMKQC